MAARNKEVSQMTYTKRTYHHSIEDAVMLIAIMMSWEQTEDVIEAIYFERQMLEELRS
jgi:hypothetical protein